MNNNLSVAILAKLEAKPGKESEVEAFLKSALALANEEATTPVWFALKLGKSTYGERIIAVYEDVITFCFDCIGVRMRD